MREAAEGKPVEIGRLQRYATDRADGARRPSVRARRADRQARRGGRAPGRRGSPARTGWRCSGTTSRSTTRGRRAAGSTNTASPPTRRRTASPRPSSTGCSGSAASSCAHGVALGRDLTLDDLRAELRRGVPRDRARRRQRARDRRARTQAGVRPAVDFIAELRQAERPGRAAGRAAGGGDRRRHDGDRRRGAVEAARRRGGDDRLSPRPRADGRERLRAGAGAAAAGVRIVTGAVPVARRAATARCARSSSPTSREGAGGLEQTGETFTLAGRPGVQGDRPDARRARPEGLALDGRQDRGRRARAAPACPGSGPAATARAGGDDLTVTAVAEGRDAAMDIHAALGG